MSQETLVEGAKLVIKRTFDAPVERVYQAWTDPAKMVRWFSANVRWKSPVIDIEPVPNGRHNIIMRHSDGEEFHIIGQYVEIVPNERISFTWKSLGAPPDTGDTLVTVEFRVVPGGTELTLTHDRQTDPNALQGASQGWSGCLDMLDSYLQGTPLLGADQS